MCQNGGTILQYVEGGMSEWTKRRWPWATPAKSVHRVPEIR